MAKIVKNNLGNFLVIFVIFVLMTSWFYSGWPRIWQNPSIPPEIQEAQAAGLAYVGGAEASGNSANYNVSLTALTGGSGSAAIAGDLVIVATGWGSIADGDPGVTTANYTEVADLYKSDNYDANFSVNWKIMGSTPDTSVTCKGSGGATYGAVCVVHVWRNANASTPMDVTPTTAIAANAAIPNSPPITPVTTGAIVIATGLGAMVAVDTSVTAPLDYGNQVDISVDPGTAATVGISSKAWSGSGAEDPAVWTNWTTVNSDSWAAVTLAIRPAVTTLGDGTDPTASETVAPGTAFKYLDQFSFVTTASLDSVTALTVVTPINSTTIASMGIYNEAMTTQYFATTSIPSGNNWSFSGGTPIPVTTSTASFRVYITVKSHADLGVGTYAITGTVSSTFTSGNGNNIAGSDTDSDTITIDNLSPSNATWGTITPGDANIILNWTNPGADFNKVLILRKASSVVGDSPIDGTEYAVDYTFGGGSIVRYVGSLETFTDTVGLANGTDYYYKIFAYDNYINYAAGSGIGPYTPYVVSISINDNNVAFQTVALDATADNSSDVQVITVDSGPANLRVETTVFNDPGPPSYDWSLDTSNGDYIVQWEFATTSIDGPWYNFTAVEPTSYFLANSVPAGEMNLYLRLTMPTATHSYNQYSATVTVVASAP